MIMNKRVTGKAKSLPFGIGIGLLSGMALTIGVVAIVANLILNEKMGEQTIGYAAIVVLLTSSALGAWLATTMVKRRWMLVCLATGGGYFLCLLAITALFFGGQFQGVGATVISVIGGCGAVGLLGLKGETGHRNNRRKYRSR